MGWHIVVTEKSVTIWYYRSRFSLGNKYWSRSNTKPG